MPIFKSVTLVCENESWLLPYVSLLMRKLQERGVSSTLVNEYHEIKNGDAAFFLACTKICPKALLNRNRYNFVVHESDLPKGRGFAPVSWTILEDGKEIVFSLIEATDEVDAGKIYSQLRVPLRGNELCSEIRDLQGKKTIQICLDFVLNGSLQAAKEQKGEPTYYRRRRPCDSELDINKSIAEQFNLFRIVDNDEYPAFFKHKGRVYRLTIEDIGNIHDG